MSLEVEKAREKNPTNEFRVPLRQWRKWTIVGKNVFNKVYAYARQNPDFFRHPKATEIPKEHFDVMAWNFAFIAADIASRGENALLKYLVRDIRGWDRYGDPDV